MMGCLPPSSLRLFCLKEKYRHRPAPLSCPQIKPSWDCSIACQCFTEFLSFTVCTTSPAGRPSSNIQEKGLEDLAIQFEMNTSHMGHKVLPRLPQSTRWLRCSNKGREEEKSGKCTDLKKTSITRVRRERAKNSKHGALAAGAY